MTKQAELLEEIKSKYEKIDQNPDVHLEGLLWSKPITYWDYTLTDSLLNLQVQRTSLPDEMVFILYHQINELIFKMILWEIEQVSHHDDLQPDFFSERLMRISRCFDMLSASFSIMTLNMEVDQYLKFRTTLTPASGFQSAQYRQIEICSTELINLIDARFRENIDRDTPYDHAFEHMYWQAAGKDHKTGKKNTLMRLFEERYKDHFIRVMQEYNTINLWTKFKSLPQSTKDNVNLINTMRHFDHTVNIRWVMAHYSTAEKYLESDNKTAEATGGSDWKKYMHPKYQRRVFFPELWSAEELKTWGVDNLESVRILESNTI